MPDGAVGSTVTWTYKVTNTGLVPLTNIVVTDDNGTPGNTADDFVVGTIPGPLAPGASATLTHTGVATPGPYNNAATAQSAVTTATTTFTVLADGADRYFGAGPAINIVKQTNGPDTTARPARSSRSAAR